MIMRNGYLYKKQREIYRYVYTMLLFCCQFVRLLSMNIQFRTDEKQK